jgi:isoquinoline 1-oxidoreductase beta subunit
MSAVLNVTRRDFLTALGLSSAGLCLGVFARTTEPTNEPGGDTEPKPKTSSETQENKSIGLNPNVFIHIAATGVVSIVCHRSEMGQGIRSSLPVLLADELGADMKTVQILQADGDKKYGDQNTDGSNSVRGIYETMRKAAATARHMLIMAAAKRWKVGPEKLYTDKNFVLQKGSKKKLSFGELAIEAGALEVPKPQDVKLRPVKELKNMGKDLPLIDGPLFVTGKANFGADIKLPDMLVAIISRPPVVGGIVKSYDGKKTLAVGGVRKIVKMPEPKAPYMFQPWGGVAVLADNTWSAIQGREQLSINWDHGPNASYNTQDFREKLFASAKKGGVPLRKKGDVDGALKTASKTLQAEYYVPHLMHVPMEPPVAIAHYKKENGGSCEVWAPTQNPQAARTEVARVLGLPEEKVAVHVTFLGGGFGRKSKADFCSEAAWLSKEVGVPVRVQFTREDDVHNDYLNTVNAQVMTAGLDEQGKVIAWKQNTAFPPIPSLFDTSIKAPGPGDLQQGVLDLALNIPNVEAQACEAQSHVRIGWLRSVYNIFHAFASNSFMDEIAHANKRDPLDVMLEMYSDNNMSLEDLGIKDLKNYGQTISEHPVNGARLKAVLNRVAKNSNWKKRSSLKGRGLGIAAHRSFLSYVGVVASVTKKKTGELWVDEVWIVIDAGTVLNTDRVRAQMEGSVLNAMGHFFYGGVTHKNGAVEQSSYDDARIVNMGDIPRKINIEILKSTERPGGVGEPGVPPVAPAIANAIFALTGKRIREFNSPEL